MDVSLCVALSPDGAERERNWTFLRERYERLFDWEIVTSDKLGHPWSKGTALHDAVSRASHERLILADADMMLAPDILARSVEMLRFAGWVVPHRKVYRLTEEITCRVIDGELGDKPFPTSPQWVVRRPYIGPRAGGILAITRQAWETSGGMDPRFRGWGGEDISFAKALLTLVGPCKRLAAPAWHLWHQNQAVTAGRRGAPANERLAGRYKDAHKDPEQMRLLTKEAHVDRDAHQPARHDHPALAVR